MKPLRPIAAGASVAAGDFEASPCSGDKTPAFRYDAPTRTARAIRQLHPGEAVERLPAALLPAVRAGDTLTVSSTVGRVRVDREVRALQAASVGERLFVRAADGTVFSVQLSEVRP